MLNTWSRIVVTRILVSNKFHKPPVIMRQNTKNELIKLLATDDMRNRCHYDVVARRSKTSNYASRSFVWTVYLSPAERLDIWLNPVMKVILSMDEFLALFTDTDTPGGAYIL